MIRHVFTSKLGQFGLTSSALEVLRFIKQMGAVMPMIVLKNARLIPALTEGFSGDHGDIILDGKVIREILPAGTGPDGAEVIDLQGKTLLPGLFDLHMHLYFSSDNFAAVALRTQNDYIFDAISYAKEFLRQGFTTIRDAGNPYYIGIALRDAIQSGIVPGPRIVSSGIILTPYAKGNESFPNLYKPVNSPQEMLAACRYEHARGVDYIKYMATGSVANLTGVPGELISSREEIFALQAAAESVGTPAMVHCHGTEGILYCAEAGISTIEHASMIDEACIEAILRRNGKTSIVPTLDPVVQIHRSDDGGAMPPIIHEKIELVYAHTRQIVQASRAGILTGWGTDVSMDFFADNPGYEFDARREIGYTNLEMLQQATINSAKILGMDDRLGTIKAGKLADLVVVEGRPDEDISAMLQYPFAVFKEGVRCF